MVPTPTVLRTKRALQPPPRFTELGLLILAAATFSKHTWSPKPLGIDEVAPYQGPLRPIRFFKVKVGAGRSQRGYLLRPKLKGHQKAVIKTTQLTVGIGSEWTFL